jgi:hypothetical protein
MGRSGVGAGLVAGIAGTAVMTVAEKAEQMITGRPDSYVPARTAARLFRRPRPNRKSRVRNWAMHWGTGAALGAARGLMAGRGLRGPLWSTVHLTLRLATDESLENAVGTSKPPWTWPRDIAMVDIGHKAVYALATGAFADALVRRKDERSARVSEETP